MAHRTFFPYARYTPADFEDIDLTSNVLRAVVLEFMHNEKLWGWVKPSVWEKHIFRNLEDKYRMVRGIGTEFHKIRSALYTIMDVFVKENIIEMQGGDGWAYPVFKFDFVSLWRLRYHRLGILFFDLDKK